MLHPEEWVRVWRSYLFICVSFLWAPRAADWSKGESLTSLLLLALESKCSNSSETFFISHCQGMDCGTVIHSMQNFIPLSSHLWEMLINAERFFGFVLCRLCARKPSWNVSFHISTLTVRKKQKKTFCLPAAGVCLRETHRELLKPLIPHGVPPTFSFFWTVSFRTRTAFQNLLT